MKTFNCDHCGQSVYFDNFSCLRCKKQLAYIADLQFVGSLDEVEPGVFTSPVPAAKDRLFRLCSNAQYNVCNSAIDHDDANSLCHYCELTHIKPDLLKPENLFAWQKIETAKRRLLYTLETLELAIPNKDQYPDTGLSFLFLADPEDPEEPPVLTGHANGVITLNIAEADDSIREKRKAELHEPYRTLLGHMRHEVGHYYWDRLIADRDNFASFRALFGDEQLDYAEALKAYYNDGPKPNWQAEYVSAYSTMHPWEDWAETFSHYLHMVDTLQTANDAGMSLKPKQKSQLGLRSAPDATDGASFDRMIDSWYAVSILHNNLNRSMGLPDAYPFVITGQVVEKLRYIHSMIEKAVAEGPLPKNDKSQLPEPTTAV